MHQMVDTFKEYGPSILCTEQILPSETDKYSIVEITADNGTVVNISEIVETLQA